MFYVYALKSLSNGDLYIGYSSDLKQRLNAHNEGHVSSTKGYRPWQLVYYEAYKDKKDAIIREKELKKHQKKDILREQIQNSLKDIGALAKG